MELLNHHQRHTKCRSHTWCWFWKPES